MTHKQGRRAQLGSLLALALGAVAIFVLPGLASARDHSSDSTTAIQSFDPTTRTLVLSLPAGETVSGKVTRRTKIRCEDQSGDRHGGDRVRGREAEPGDDRGGHDDNGAGANCTTADLVPGAAVEGVDLEFGADTVRFDEIELGH